MVDNEYYYLIDFDPPLTEVSKEEHSFVHMEIQGSLASTAWFISKLREDGLRGRIICMSGPTKFYRRLEED